MWNMQVLYYLTGCHATLVHVASFQGFTFRGSTMHGTF